MFNYFARPWVFFCWDPEIHRDSSELVDTIFLSHCITFQAVFCCRAGFLISSNLPEIIDF